MRWGKNICAQKVGKASVAMSLKVGKVFSLTCVHSAMHDAERYSQSYLVYWRQLPDANWKTTNSLISVERITNFIFSLFFLRVIKLFFWVASREIIFHNFARNRRATSISRHTFRPLWSTEANPITCGRLISSICGDSKFSPQYCNRLCDLLLTARHCRIFPWF